MLSERAKEGQRLPVLVLSPSLRIHLEVTLVVNLGHILLTLFFYYLFLFLFFYLAHPGRLTPSAGLVVHQLSVTDFQLAGPTILRPRLEIWTFHDKVGPAKSNWVRLGGGNKCQCWRLQISNLKVRIWKATSSSLLFRSLRLGPEVTWKKGFQANMDIWDSLDNDILDNSGHFLKSWTKHVLCVHQ